jgi:hypothetical protein
MLDVERNVGWDTEPLTGNLNRERLAGLDGIGEPAELRGELRARVGTRQVSLLHVQISFLEERLSIGLFELVRLKKAYPQRAFFS